MSEKLYALLLRLYPARFRRQYGEEARRVFRERLRDERGAWSQLRLWLELLQDLGSSLPREYRRRSSPLAAVSAPAQTGMPQFRSLETELPKPGSFLGGTLMAFVAVAGLGFLLNHAGKVRVWAVQYAAPQARASARQSSATLPAGQGPGGAGSPSASAGQTSAQPASAGQTSPPPPPQMGPALQLDDAARHRILTAVEATLRQSCPSARMAQRIAASLSASENRGAYETLSDAAAFADTITQQMRAVSGDSGLVLYFVATPLPKTPAAGDIHWIDMHFLLRVPLPQPALPHTASQA
ncbi:MAG TPA: hypothetical protein VMD92_18330 [Acidobacteriaceae bacterium]|nr:hypothetical protein [Acidobacteriaceae bacterium]